MRTAEFILCVVCVAVQSIVAARAATTAPAATQAAVAPDPIESACQALKKLVDDSPGRADVAVDALGKILARTSDYARIERGAYWQAYAAERLLAMEGCGQLARGGPQHLAALKALYALRRDEGRNWEAHKLLVSIEGLVGEDRWCKIQRAELPARMGRRDEAQRLYRMVVPGGNEIVLQERIQQVLSMPPDVQPTFTRKMDVLDKCALLDRAADADRAAVVDAILRLDSRSDSTIGLDKLRVASVWSWLDRRLTSLEKDPLAALASAQEQQAALQPPASAGFQEATAFFRRFPLAATAHKTLLEAAEDQLRQGRSGLALRAFRDVLDHSVDPAMRGRAQVGVWLAMAQDGRQAEALAESLASASDDSYPWLGGQATARTIRQRLDTGPGLPASRPAAPGPGSMDFRELRLPPWPAWTLAALGDIPRQTIATLPCAGWLVENGGRLIVAGPRLLACYGRQRDDPLWTAAPRIPEGLMGSFFSEPESPKYRAVPGDVVPAIAEAKVFARWGQDPVGRYCKALAAFDLDTGRMVWSTDGLPDWKDTWPINDPVVWQGRLYVLTAQKGPLTALPVALVCADAATAKVIWRRPLAVQDPSARGRYSYAHFGNPVAVREGAVYVCSNLGFAARCDARDGVLEWAFTYQRDCLTEHNGQYITRRMGAAPIIAGDLVIFAPRDRQGAFALDRGTGEPRWENAFTPSERALGEAGGLILFKDGHIVAGVQAATGKVVWDRRVDEEILPQSAVSGSTALVATRSTVYQLDAATGAIKERLASGADRALMGLSTYGDRPIVITSRSVAPATGPAPEAVAVAAAPTAAPTTGPDGVPPPMVEAWRIVRPSPRLLVPPPEAAIGDKVFLLTDSILECVSAGPKIEVRWRRLLEPGFQVTWAPGRLLLIYDRRVVSLNPADGAVQWDVQVPFSVKQFKSRAPWLVLAEYEPVFRSMGRHTGVINVDTGRLLWDSRFIRAVGGDSVHDSFSHIEWEGQDLHLFGPRIERGSARQVICRPADGLVLKAGRDAAGTIHPRMNYYEDRMRSVTELAYESTETSGPWFVAHFASSDRQTQRTNILRLDEPTYELVIPNRATISGDFVYDAAGNALNRTYLPTKGRTTYLVPISAQDLGSGGVVLHHWERGKSIMVLSGIIRRRISAGGGIFPSALRLDAFDLDGGRHLWRQSLPDAIYSLTYSVRDWGFRDAVAGTQAASVHDVLFIADPRGLQAYVPGTAGAAQSYDRPKLPVPRRSDIEVDGAPDDWANQAPIACVGPGGSGAGLYLSRDAHDLFIAMSAPADGRGPFMGRSDFSGGDMIEINLLGGTTYNYSCLIGLDGAGRLVVGNLGDASANKDYYIALFDELPRLNRPDGAQCVVRYDAIGRRIVCELSVPLKYLLPERPDPRNTNVALSVAAWGASASCMVRPRAVWRGILDLPQSGADAGAPRRPARSSPRQ
ncbi:MAG: PQQ-binding-like beta-propeller repeat protein [Phycisphaerae bacterium]